MVAAREWQSGDVGVTTRGTVALRRINNPAGWIDQHGAPWSTDRFPDNVRPLVVIDPECTETALEPIWVALRDGHALRSRPDLREALRALANPQPPKPEEPTGLGAVVEDADGALWVRHEKVALAYMHWHRVGAHSVAKWSGIAAVKVLSEGVSA